jgi:hypothetical protein
MFLRCSVCEIDSVATVQFEFGRKDIPDAAKDCRPFVSRVHFKVIGTDPEGKKVTILHSGLANAIVESGGTKRTVKKDDEVELALRDKYYPIGDPKWDHMFFVLTLGTGDVTEVPDSQEQDVDPPPMPSGEVFVKTGRVAEVQAAGNDDVAAEPPYMTAEDENALVKAFIDDKDKPCKMLELSACEEAAALSYAIGNKGGRIGNTQVMPGAQIPRGRCLRLPELVDAPMRTFRFPMLEKMLKAQIPKSQKGSYTSSLWSDEHAAMDVELAASLFPSSKLIDRELVPLPIEDEFWSSKERVGVADKGIPLKRAKTKRTIRPVVTKE